VTRRCYGGRLGGAVRVAAILAACFSLTDCGKSDRYAERARYRDTDEIPRGGGRYAVGKPYMIAGRVYFPAEDPNYRADGIASWYGRDFHGSRTANGEIYDMHALTAAHPTLPMPSYVRVTNQLNQRSVIVRVNDRGPFRGGRVIDVSVKTAELLGFHRSGLAPVRVEYVGRASLKGSDDRILEATLRTGEPAPAPSNVRIAAARPLVPEPALPVATRPAVRERVAATPPGRTEWRDEDPEVASTARTRPERVAAPPPAAFAPLRSLGSFFTGRDLY
jgi:rare lipoprotein A